VDSSKKSTRLSRALATGLSLALVGGLSLVAAAPAHANADYLPLDEPDVFEADIGPAQTNPLGWHVSGDTTQVEISSAGLVLQPGDAVSYAVDDSYERILNYNLSTSISRGDVTWTTFSDTPADYTMFFSYGEDPQDLSYTMLASTQAVKGKNTASLSQIWTTSNQMGTEFAQGSDYELADLTRFLEAQPNGKLISFGVAAPRPSTLSGNTIDNMAGSASAVSSLSWETGTYSFRAGLRMAPGTVSVTGEALVGSTVTAATDGWPEEAKFSYEWFQAQDSMGGALASTGNTHAIEVGSVNYGIGVIVTVSADGYFPVTLRSERTAAVTAPKAAAAAAPVADSSGLAAYLASKNVTVGTAASAGLPAGDLNRNEPATATAAWASNDSFVDVYAYSSPVLVGSFPVANNQVKIVLSSSMLSLLGSGSHTLVILGQSSAAVQAVAFDVDEANTAAAAAAAAAAPTLAETGVAAAAPIGIAALLLLLGAALLIERRRRTTA